MDDDLVLELRDLDDEFALGTGALFAGEFFADLKAGLAAGTGDVDGHRIARGGEAQCVVTERSWPRGGNRCRREPARRSSVPIPPLDANIVSHTAGRRQGCVEGASALDYDQFLGLSTG